MESKKVTLYLGSGVSIGNGLPSWENLVLSLFFNSLDKKPLGNWRPYANYLFAISEWYLNNLQEPLDITARKILESYKNKNDFLEKLKNTLYAGFQLNQPYPRDFENTVLLESNPTLRAVCKLCKSDKISDVISYNYDNLLEIALNDYPSQPIWGNFEMQTNALPIYHVHGYIPYGDTKGSAVSKIVFTEDQYHLIAQNPFHWSTLVQIKSLSNNVGLMIGLSLSDKNLRRLLDAVAKAPFKTQNYALLKKPVWQEPSDDELLKIHKRAKDYLNLFENSGIKTDSGVKGPNWKFEIAGILREVDNKSVELQEKILNSFHIKPIWYNEYDEIEVIINRLLS